MSEDNLRRSRDLQDNLTRKLAGDDPIQKQIMLLKLTDLSENPPNPTHTNFEAGTPGRQWVSQVQALLNRFYKAEFEFTARFALKQNVEHLSVNSHMATNRIRVLVSDAIEALKLELELDGREQIGNAYAPGNYYDYFRDLKKIIAEAKQQIFVIDPYFNGEAFDAYLSESRRIKILILADKYSNDTKDYADRHTKQYGTTIELRRSKELHDRLILIDGDECWITGGSVKDAGKSAAYLIPTAPQIAVAKRDIYSEIWGRAAFLT